MDQEASAGFLFFTLGVGSNFRGAFTSQATRTLNLLLPGNLNCSQATLFAAAGAAGAAGEDGAAGAAGEDGAAGAAGAAAAPLEMTRPTGSGTARSTIVDSLGRAKI